MREKANTFEVAEPDKAMRSFESLLGKLVKVTKGELKAKRKRVRQTPRPKPKG